MLETARHPAGEPALRLDRRIDHLRRRRGPERAADGPGPDPALQPQPVRGGGAGHGRRPAAGLAEAGGPAARPGTWSLRPQPGRGGGLRPPAGGRPVRRPHPHRPHPRPRGVAMDLDQAKQTYIIEVPGTPGRHGGGPARASRRGRPLRGHQRHVPGGAHHQRLRRPVRPGRIVRFAHTVESVMDRVRSQAAAAHPRPGRASSWSATTIWALVGETQEGAEEDRRAGRPASGSWPGWRRYLGGGAGPGRRRQSAVDRSRGAAPRPRKGPAANAGTSPSASAGTCSGTAWTPLLRPLPGHPGRDRPPGPPARPVPVREAFDPEACYLGLEMDLDTEADRRTLEDVFEFVRDDSQIRLIPPHAKVEDYIQLIRELPEEDRFLGEILVAGGCLTDARAGGGPPIQKEEARSRAPSRGACWAPS